MSSFGLWHTIRREWQRIVSRPFYVVVTLGVPLVATLFMSSIFGSGRIENIPIGVVDEDFTSTTRATIRAIDATPALLVAHHYTSPAEALSAVRSKDIYGYVLFPAHFEADLVANRAPTVEYVYHYALMSVGGVVEATLATLLTGVTIRPIEATATSFGLSPQAISALVMPIQADSLALFNPSLNYSAYLSLPLLMVILQIVVLLTTIYVVGAEIKSGTAIRWLIGADGNIFKAIVGKLAPYTLAFSVAAVGSVAWLYGGVGGLPYGEGALWLLSVWGVGLVVSSQALGLFIYGLFPALGFIISVGSMIGSLGATLCGVTFPLGAIAPVFHPVAALLPIRHYTLLAQNILYGNYGTEWVWENIVAMLVVCALPTLILPRLRRVIISRRYEKID